MKAIKFFIKLICQTIVGIFITNVAFLAATIKAAINCYPNNAEVNVSISYGGSKKDA
jgi:hypothetical protein